MMFRSKCELKDGVKYHLGCGKIYQEGWVNVDHDKTVKADKHEDVIFTLKVAGNNTINWIFADNVIEHIQQYDIVDLFHDIHRILKKGGVVELFVPLFPTNSAVCDPTHMSYFVPETFARFTKAFWDNQNSNGFGFYFKIDALAKSDTEIYVRMIKEDSYENQDLVQ